MYFKHRKNGALKWILNYAWQSKELLNEIVNWTMIVISPMFSCFKISKNFCLTKKFWIFDTLSENLPLGLSDVGTLYDSINEFSRDARCIAFSPRSYLKNKFLLSKQSFETIKFKVVKVINWSEDLIT